MADKPAQVQVEIFGQTYSVRAGGDPAQLQEIASYVDAEMREVSKAAGAVDTVRIAVLAALNIAADALRMRAEAKQAIADARGHAEKELASRAEAMSRELARALSE
jgi:cell division protein ZapA